MMVGVIEETSKFWVLRKSGERFFTSVADVLQIAIIVAIGFAFGENLINPNYFVGFVLHYLIESNAPQWAPFLGNVLGRAILTNMVHILSTGMMGFFFAQAFFATPLLKEQYAQGKRHPAAQWFHDVLGMKPEDVYGREMMIQGLLIAIVLHGTFDFIVSLPNILPGNPSTIGALLGSAPGSFLHSISIILIPALVYVVGGAWLLVYLVTRGSSEHEYGKRVATDSFVTVTQQ
jgi:hypothetical protein